MRSPLLKHILFMIVLLILSVGSINAQNEPLTLPVSLDWSPDGAKIATGHEDGYIAIWNAATGDLLNIYQVMNPALTERSIQTIRNVKWSPDGEYLAVSNLDEIPYGLIVILDATTGEQLSYMGTQGGFPDIAWSPDGQFLASVVSSVSQIALADALVIWNPLTGEEIRRINPHELVGLHSIAWSPDGQKIVVGGTIDNLITIWDVATGSKLQTLVAHTEQTNSVDWSAVTGQIVSNSGTDKMINIWNGDTGQLLQSLSVEGFPRDAKWHPNNPVVATATFDEKYNANILFLDVTTGQITAAIPLSNFTGQEQIEWSPYGGRLAYTRTIPEANQGDMRSLTLNKSGIEMIVPIASVAQLNTIAAACQAEALVPEQTGSLLNGDQVQTLTSSTLPDFIAQVEALPANAIPAACRADLLAVAGALR